MTDPTTLSLADLAAAVVRLAPLHAASEDFIELVWVGRAYTQEPAPTVESKSFYVAAHEVMPLLLAAANRLPAVVAEMARTAAECGDLRREVAQLGADLDNMAARETAALRAEVERLAAEAADLRSRFLDTTSDAVWTKHQRDTARAKADQHERDWVEAKHEFGRVSKDLADAVERLTVDLRCEKIRSEDRGASFAESQREVERLTAELAAATERDPETNTSVGLLRVQRHRLRQDLAAITVERDNALSECERLRNFAVCAWCGPFVKVDEDGCCEHCGADCMLVEDGRATSVPEHWQNDIDAVVSFDAPKETP